MDTIPMQAPTFWRAISSALALSLALSAGTLFAQSTETQPETPAPETTGNSLVDGLSTGTPVAPAGPTLGQPYVREVTGDWELRCIRGEEPAAEPCQLYQLLRDRSGNPVSEVNVFRLADGGNIVAGANVIVPLETLLTGQLTVAVDGENVRQYPFSFCNTVGCFARLGLTQADVDAFKRGAIAQVQIRPVSAPNETVTVDMSLTGFTAGFDQMTPNN